MIWKKKKSITSAQEKFKNEKVLKKEDTSNLKGGKSRRDILWNGCGGMIPH